jgi:hypothetical protein
MFNEAYYREAVAKAIAFREAEYLVPKQPWYEGGYRANIVAYGIAKLARDVEQQDGAVDFERIWRAQQLSEAMREALLLACEAAKDVLGSPIAGVKNVTEWAKMPACWDRVSALQIAWPEAWLAELMTTEQRQGLVRSAVKEQKMINAVEAEIAVHALGAAKWRQVKAWGVERQLLTQKESDILDVAIAMPRRMPSDKQSVVLMKLLKRLQKEGCLVGTE